MKIPSTVEVVYMDRMWHVRRDDFVSRANQPMWNTILTYQFKWQAKIAARALAIDGELELKIKTRKGRIVQGPSGRSSFGNDPIGRG